MWQRVTFKSGGTNCAADLYLPPGFSASHRYPALVLGHGTAQTKKSLVSQGEFFARAGYVVLAIDYRSFGESEGEPRGQLFPLVQVEDFRNGVSFLQRAPGVDREHIGIWGTSNSGGTVIHAAGIDRRIKAVVAASTSSESLPLDALAAFAKGMVGVARPRRRGSSASL